MKPRRLKVVRLDEISLVDRPANPLARISIWKRDTSEDEPVSEHNTNTEHTEITEEQAVNWLTKAMIAVGFKQSEKVVENNETSETEETTEKIMAEETTQDQPEAISKAEFEALTKRLETAEANAQAQTEKVEKLQNEKLEAEFVKRASEFKSLPIKATEFGPVMKRAADVLSEEDYQAIEQALASANEVARLGKVTQELGSDTPAEGSAVAEVAAKVADLRKAHPELDEQAARGQVYMNHPELRQRVVAEQAPAGR